LTRKELLERCRTKMLAHSANDLQTLLYDLIHHGVIVVKQGKDQASGSSMDVLEINMPKKTLQKTLAYVRKDIQTRKKAV